MHKIKDSAQELEHRNLHDTLTGLPNRLQIEKILKNRIPETAPENGPFSVLILVLIGLRDIIDTVGYEFYDMLIVNISESLNSLCEKSTNVLRVGGSVSCLICNTYLACININDITNRVHDSMELHKEIDGVPLNITCRIEISVNPTDSVEPRELVRLADIALLQAKVTRNRTLLYQVDNDQNSIRKLSLLARFQTAILESEFDLNSPLSTFGGDLQAMLCALRCKSNFSGLQSLN